MKYVFFIIFCILSYVVISILGFFAIFLALWYWDGKFITLLDNAEESLINHLKSKL